MQHRYPIGASDFRELRTMGLHYVDKTRLIMGILDDLGTRVFLFPRPRRFGKTLNLSMLGAFFEKRPEDLSPLFEGLEVWNVGDFYRSHFQRYPVIQLTFKDQKPTRLNGWLESVRVLLARLYETHRDLLEGSLLSPLERRHFESVRDASASEVVLGRALQALSEYLHRRHGEQVVILIDEYDTPVHAAYMGGFAQEVLAFFRDFLGAGLKDNPCVFKAVITGILRIAKENIFSGLNNPGVYSLLSSDFSDCFGFTEPELLDLLERTGNTEYLEVIRTWYNGYRFGETVIYNPWSVLNFLRSSDKVPRPYWLNTSSNELVREQLAHFALEAEAQVRGLLEGGHIDLYLDDSIVLDQIQDNVERLWNLLTFTGYLKAEALPALPLSEPMYRLSIPNLEVRRLYLSSYASWMRTQWRGSSSSLDRMLKSMFMGNAEELEAYLGEFASGILSIHDRAARYPETMYHGLVLGLCAVLEPSHRVLSNRESGKGRADVLLIPRQVGGPGVVLELKVARAHVPLEQALRDGLQQLQARDYGAELRAVGADPIQAYAVAFDGETVRVASVEG